MPDAKRAAWNVAALVLVNPSQLNPMADLMLVVLPVQKLVGLTTALLVSTTTLRVWAPAKNEEASKMAIVRNFFILESLYPHFGVGDASVHWPDNKRNVFGIVASLELIKSGGRSE